MQPLIGRSLFGQPEVFKIHSEILYPGSSFRQSNGVAKTIFSNPLLHVHLCMCKCWHTGDALYVGETHTLVHIHGVGVWALRCVSLIGAHSRCLCFLKYLNYCAHIHKNVFANNVFIMNHYRYMHIQIYYVCKSFVVLFCLCISAIPNRLT